MLHYEIVITLVYFKIYSQVIAKREPFTVWLILLYVFFKKYTVLDLLWGKEKSCVHDFLCVFVLSMWSFNCVTYLADFL